MKPQRRLGPASAVAHALALALALLAANACDDASTRTTDTMPTSQDRAGFEGTTRFGFRPAPPPAQGADVRSRADAAFAELMEADRAHSEPDRAGTSAGAPDRFDTRVGPQAWPSNLPRSWPIPDSGRLIADTSRAQGGRLLLVDLPGEPDRALDAYSEALLEAGFEVDRGERDSAPRALFARRGEDQAVLTFVAHETDTRLEILFVTDTSG